MHVYENIQVVKIIKIWFCKRTVIYFYISIVIYEHLYHNVMRILNKTLFYYNCLLCVILSYKESDLKNNL